MPEREPPPNDIPLEGNPSENEEIEPTSTASISYLDLARQWRASGVPQETIEQIIYESLKEDIVIWANNASHAQEPETMSGFLGTDNHTQHAEHLPYDEGEVSRQLGKPQKNIWQKANYNKKRRTTNS